MNAPHDGDPAVIELATRLFDMARAGDTAALGAYLDALSRGADPNRPTIEARPRSLGRRSRARMASCALLDGGADPFAGQPSAAETAQMFGRDDYVALFEQRG